MTTASPGRRRPRPARASVPARTSRTICAASERPSRMAALRRAILACARRTPRCRQLGRPKEQIVKFFKVLLEHIGSKLLIIWDGLPGHRSAPVRRYVESLRDRSQLKVLLTCSHELNPVEFLWGHLKRPEVSNFCPADLLALKQSAHRRLRSMQCR